MSMIIVDGKIKVNDEMKKQYADACKINLIKLVHSSGFGQDGGDISISGFQHVNIKTGEANGKKTFVARWAKDQEGNATCVGRALVFEPDRVTGQMLAYLPDSEFNRNKLARCYYHGADWTIAEPGIEAEIKKMADEFEITLPVPISKEEIITDQATEIEELRAKLAEAEQKVGIKDAAKAIIKKNKGGRPRKIQKPVEKTENVNDLNVANGVPA